MCTDTQANTPAHKSTPHKHNDDEDPEPSLGMSARMLQAVRVIEATKNQTGLKSAKAVRQYEWCG